MEYPKKVQKIIVNKFNSIFLFIHIKYKKNRLVKV